MVLLTSYDTEIILRIKDYLEVTCIQSSSIVRSSTIQFLTTIVKHENKYDTIDRKIPLKKRKYFFASTEEKLASVSFFAIVLLLVKTVIHQQRRRQMQAFPLCSERNIYGSSVESSDQ